MINNLIKPSDYNYVKARESRPLSSLFNLISDIKIIYSNICNKIYNNRINYNSNITYNNFDLIKDDIKDIYELLSIYLSSQTEVDIAFEKLSEKDSITTSINHKNYLISMDYSNIECLIIPQHCNIKNDDFLLIYDKYKEIKRILFNEYTEIESIFKTLDDVSIITRINDDIIRMIKFDYLNSLTINSNFDIKLHIEYCFNFITTILNNKYYLMIEKECCNIVDGISIYAINDINKNNVVDIEKSFIQNVYVVANSVTERINNIKYKVHDTLKELNSIEDNFTIQINDNVDYIALSRHLDNTNISISMDMIEEFNIDLDKICTNGNIYTKNNIIEFLNNTLISLNNLLKEFEDYVNKMNLNMVEFETIVVDNNLLEESKVFLFSMSKLVTEGELTSYIVKKPLDINNIVSSSHNLKVYANVYEELFSQLKINPIKDEQLEFNYESTKDYESVFGRTIHNSLVEFLKLKYRFIDKKELPTYYSIYNLTEEYDHILPKNLVPIDDARDIIVCCDNNGSVVSFNKMTKEIKNISSHMTGYIRLIHDKFLI